jgi:nucleotide-binding universal stress UspA family protein
MQEIKLILCPFDFSEFSVRAYRHAMSLAEHYRARLVVQHIVEVWRHPSASFAATASLYDEYCQSLRGNGKEQLQEFVKNHTYNEEVQPELVVDEGIAPDSILSFAQEQKSDLIVMGTHGLRGFDRLMLGSATDRVMRRAICPVLAVREPTHDSIAAGQERHYLHHLNRILCCTDFSEDSDRALNYAISATVEYDAELTLLHVLEVPTPAKTEKAIAATTEQLDKLIPSERRKTLKIKTAVRTGKPYTEIIRYAQEAQTDLVSMGVHGRGALDLAVFGSTTYRVMQLGPCPVLTAHV